MKVVGTDNQEMEVVFGENCFESGDLLYFGENMCTVIRRNEYPYTFNFIGDLFEFTVYVHLEGEELETAINHFKFLRKYNLV